ncbi:type VI secretion system tube protein TssD (plasmid) [Bernardetia sp. OM2101]|uniref:type VI secretion system tube protein TssD n=1 Tax=Bernardetia sp. OM2101 TaxID=3344876 RepID=UPI0035D07597
MSSVSKLYVEDKEITILDFKFRFTRSTDEHGKPMGKPRGTIFEITFETTADQSFMEWSVSTDMMKNVKIVVSPVTATSKSRIIELYDVCCVFFKNNFNAQNGEPMTTLIHLTPAIMIDDGYKVLDHYWKKTDLSADSPVTTVEPEKQKQLISAHFEDENRKKIEQEEIDNQTVFLVLITKDTVGKPISINVDNENHYFKYNGKLLEDGLIENLTVTADTMRLELEAITK